MSRSPFHLFACYQDMFARKEYRNVESEGEAAQWLAIMRSTMPDARYVTDTEWQQILKNERFPRLGGAAVAKPATPEVKPVTPEVKPVIPDHVYSTREVIDEIKRRHPAIPEQADLIADDAPNNSIKNWTDWALAAKLAIALEQIKRGI